jgi:hypothetical protein
LVRFAMLNPAAFPLTPLDVARPLGKSGSNNDSGCDTQD